MTNIIPERTAGAIELARETARILPCACGARPGYSCDGKGGFHVGRFADARRPGGHITEGQMAAVLSAAGPVFTAKTIIPAGAR